MATLKQLAENRAYMDVSRVGIFGLSMGGYYVVRALLQAPDVFHVGIAVALVIEISEHGNYLWLGPPERNKEAYAYASNLRLASNLKGKLLLIHGTSDIWVPFLPDDEDGGGADPRGQALRPDCPAGVGTLGK